MSLWRLAPCVVVLLLVANKWESFVDWLVVETVVIPDQPALSASLKAIPDPVLTEEQKEALRVDGLVHLKGVFPKELVAQMLPSMWPHMYHYEHGNGPTYWWNGALRSLLGDGPLGAIGASALNSRTVRTSNMQLWGYQGHEASRKHGSAMPSVNYYHADARPVRAQVHGEGRMFTVWMPFMDAPQAMTFMLGSHRYPRRFHNHCQPRSFGFNHFMQEDCLRHGAELLSAELGKPSEVTVDVAAGDVVLFDGDLLHNSRQQEAPRLALCLRVHDGERPMDGNYYPVGAVRPCDHEVVLLHPRNETEMHCIPRLGPDAPNRPRCFNDSPLNRLIDQVRWPSSVPKRTRLQNCLLE